VRLSMYSYGYSPTNATNYMHLSWNRENTVVSPHTQTYATLSLLVDANAPLVPFTFYITVAGTQT
jgi:hypothetical protein